MSLQKIHRNRAWVILYKLGFTIYSIQQAFGMKDKRNIVKIIDRDKDKYNLLDETNASSKNKVS